MRLAASNLSVYLFKTFKELISSKLQGIYPGNFIDSVPQKVVIVVIIFAVPVRSVRLVASVKMFVKYIKVLPSIR